MIMLRRVQDRMTSLAGTSQASVLAKPDHADWPGRKPPYWSRIVTSHGRQLRVAERMFLRVL
jgi:hypothetical protein